MDVVQYFRTMERYYIGTLGKSNVERERYWVSSAEGGKPTTCPFCNTAYKKKKHMKSECPFCHKRSK